MRKALELALEWIEKQPKETPDSKYDVDTRYVVIRELEAALAQPEQEPVAWRYRGNLHEFDPNDWAEGEVTPLYTSPPQRTWVGLTDEQVYEIGFDLNIGGIQTMKAYKAIEAKLKENT